MRYLPWRCARSRGAGASIGAEDEDVASRELAKCRVRGHQHAAFRPGERGEVGVHPDLRRRRRLRRVHPPEPAETGWALQRATRCARLRRTPRTPPMQPHWSARDCRSARVRRPWLRALTTTAASCDRTGCSQPRRPCPDIAGPRGDADAPAGQGLSSHRRTVIREALLVIRARRARCSRHRDLRRAAAELERAILETIADQAELPDLGPVCSRILVV